MRERVLVANRGEIAIRICRGVAAAGYDSVVIHSSDDTASLHVSAAEHRHALPGAGPAAYPDIDEVVNAAVTTGCTYVHPGYGFLSENADFARACEARSSLRCSPESETRRSSPWSDRSTRSLASLPSDSTASWSPPILRPWPKPAHALQSLCAPADRLLMSILGCRNDENGHAPVPMCEPVVPQEGTVGV